MHSILKDSFAAFNSTNGIRTDAEGYTTLASEVGDLVMDLDKVGLGGVLNEEK